jgi:4a-hydroxytetrahydrobiopterin dehydratase
MDMLGGTAITAADLTDWRKLGQGLHARFSVSDLRSGARFLTAISEADEAAEHLEVRRQR